MPAAPPQQPRSPLSVPVFRALWLASFVSSLGTWVQDVGQSWLMTSLTSSPLLVSLVATAVQLPGVLLALPAGALADLVDRRRLLLSTQSFMSLCATILAVLTFTGWISPPLLLGFTLALGVGSALSSPAWYALMPDLVPRALMSRAVVWNGVAWNVARAVGPAIGGVLVARMGPAPAFALNAASFLASITVLYRWSGAPPASLGPPESFRSAVVAGLRYARHSGDLRAVISRTALFGFFAASAMALMPLYARQQLHGGPRTYGLLLGCMGLGAVLAATVRGRLVRGVGAPALMTCGMILIAAALFALGKVPRLAVACPAMVLYGLGWLSVLSCTNTAAQMILPVWVRARGLGLYLVAFSAGLAAGSTLAGYLASHYSVAFAFSVSAAGLVAGAVLAALAPLPDESLSRDLSVRGWSEAPQVPGEDRGPVVVMVRYPVHAEADLSAARAAVRRMASIRLRDGATSWRLYEDTDEAQVLVEVFTVASWDEHLRQHHRGTAEDRRIFEQAKERCGGGAPQVIHLVAAP